MNAIHHEIAEDSDKYKPFTSKQIILVGEFLQLRLVPSTFDDGDFVSLTPIWDGNSTHV